MKSFRNIARIVGILFLAGMIIGVVGNIIIQSVFSQQDYLSTLSSNSMKVAIASVLLLFTVAGDTAHGILMFPVLKQHSEGFAVGYLGFRIVDALFLGIQVLFILAQIPLGHEFLKAEGSDTSYLNNLGAVLTQTNVYAYHIGMIFLGLAGLVLCYMFYSAKMVPRLIAVWGIVGYATMFCGSIMEVMGFKLQLMQTIPGGLWELFIGVWLIVKGFNSYQTKETPTLA